jgi:hypothetical protein
MADVVRSSAAGAVDSVLGLARANRRQEEQGQIEPLAPGAQVRGASTSSAVPPLRNAVLHFALDSSNAENDEHFGPS